MKSPLNSLFIFGSSSDTLITANITNGADV